MPAADRKRTPHEVHDWREHVRADGNDATPSQAYDDRPAMGAGKYDLDGNPVAAAAAAVDPAPSGKVGRPALATPGRCARN